MDKTTRQFKILNKKNKYLNICEGQSVYEPNAILIQIHGIGGHFQFIKDTEDLFEYKNFLFSKNSIKCYGLELSGHGKSDGLKCSIDNYEDLVEDIRSFVLYLKSEFPSKKIFIYAESMGAGLSIIYQIKYGIDSNIEAYSFIAPMCGFQDKFKPNFILISAINFLSYIFPNFKFLDIQKEMKKASKSISYLKAKLENEYQYTDKIRLNTIREIFKACNYLENNCSKFDKPVYLFHSIDDPVTCCKKTIKFYKSINNKNKKIYISKNSNHILTLPSDDNDKRPNIIINKISDFIKGFTL